MGLGQAGSSAAHDSSRSRAQTLIAVLLITACALVVRLPYFGDANADIDEQLYSLIGNAMLHGQLPFVDLWDRKPLGLFLLYALAHGVGGPGPLAYQLLATGFAIIGALLTRHLALLLVDRAIATGMAVLYLLLMPIYGSHSGQSEIFHVPAMLAMAVLVRDPDHPRAIPRALVAMLIGGLALQVKYTVIPQCLFFGLWALWGDWQRRGSWRRSVGLAAIFAVLGLLPTVLVGLYYLAIGEWAPFWFANFVSFFLRDPAPHGRFVAQHMVFLAPLAGLALAGLYGRWRIAPALPTTAPPATYPFFCGMLAAALATVYLPGTIYAYYFAALVPGVLLVALPFFAGRILWSRVFMTGAIALFTALLFYGARIEQSQRSRSGMAQLSATIAPLVDARANCLWVFDGPTALYAASGSCLPTRFIYPDHLNNALERVGLGEPQIDEVRRILARRPPAIVTAETPLTTQNEAVETLVMATLRRDYVLADRARLAHRTISVWKRREET